MAISTDELFLRQALELASRGTALASPNPLVGALVVDERGRIVGSGTHLYAELKHAEILAMEQAGPLARGNTLYLNLEPCSHTGRTGPCADAIIAAGVARVVCCMEDPNPLVAGKGFEKLRAAGIEVTVGILEGEARRLNESFAQFIRTGLPFVTLKAAMSLDGKIAGRPRPSCSRRPCLSQPGLVQLHHRRVCAPPRARNAPRLRCHPGRRRHGHRRRSPAHRPQRTAPPPATDARHSRLAPAPPAHLARGGNRQRRSRRLLLLCRGEQAPRPGIRGVHVCQVESKITVLPPNPLRTRDVPISTAFWPGSAAEKITSLLVEGGAAVNWACLRSRLVDKLVLFYTPSIFGPVGSVPWLEGQNALPADFGLTAANIKIEHFDEDFAVEAYLRDPYQPLGPQL